jgi:hypothetical protein
VSARRRAPAARRSARAWLIGPALVLLLAGCSDGGGERRFRYAEAVEVPAAVAERDRLAMTLAGYAQRNGFAFHDTSPRELRLSNGHQTLALQIQRPLTNGRLWAETEVAAFGNAPALVTFAAPLDEGIAADAERGRAELVAELRRRWPETREVPLLPGGGVPRQEDLVRTPGGLRIDAASAARYGLPADSPLLAR